MPPPSDPEVAQVAWNTCTRTLGALRKRGQWLDADDTDEPLTNDQPALAALARASSAAPSPSGRVPVPDRSRFARMEPPRSFRLSSNRPIEEAKAELLVLEPQLEKARQALAADRSPDLDPEKGKGKDRGPER